MCVDGKMSLMEEVIIFGLTRSQAHWKGCKQRKAFKDRKEYLKDHTAEAVKVSLVCGSIHLRVIKYV